MIKFISPIALLAALSWVVVSCSSEDPVYLDGDEFALEEGEVLETGSARMALTVGDRTINSVTAVISRKHGKFKSQTHTIDVTGDSGVVSIFFGNLPVGRDYQVELTASDCSGTSKFDVSSGVTTQVPVTIVCPGSSNAPEETGNVRITGTFAPGPGQVCDHVSKIVAAPATQKIPNGPLVKVDVYLEHKVTASNIVWTASSTNGGAGTIGNLVGNQDQSITFNCTAVGLVQLVAAVTASEDGKACTEQARVQIECASAGGSTGPVCGNAVVEAPEQCDGSVPAGSPTGSTCTSPGCTICGNAVITAPEQCDRSTLPAGAPAGSSCSTTCTLIVPNPPVCNNGTITPPEPCDPSAVPPVPAGSPPGSTCSTTCTIGRCGDNAINGAETCDASANPTVPAGSPPGSSCSTACTIGRCGDNVINGSEQCDGPALPAGTPSGTVCTSTCTLPVPATCGNGVVVAPEPCDFSATPPVPSSPAGHTCSQTCTLGICGDVSINGAELCDASANPKVPASAPPGSSCGTTCNIGRCGDNAINGAELCDPSASPQFPTTPPSGTTCSSACLVVLPPRCGDNAINGTEECDASAVPPVPASAPAGSTCSGFCTLIPPTGGPRCGDNLINQASEQCDGPALPPTAPPGSSCNSACMLVPPPGAGTCHQTCVVDEATASCSLEFGLLLPDSDPIMDCIVGADWPAPNKFPVTSCANGALSSCYCGTLAQGPCNSALPSALTGQCTQQILAGTGCTTLPNGQPRPAAEQGACVAQRFTLDNSTGRAVNYLACLQNNCPDICQTPAAP